MLYKGLGVVGRGCLGLVIGRKSILYVVFLVVGTTICDNQRIL